MALIGHFFLVAFVPAFVSGKQRSRTGDYDYDQDYDYDGIPQPALPALLLVIVLVIVISAARPGACHPNGDHRFMTQNREGRRPRRPND